MRVRASARVGAILAAHGAALAAEVLAVGVTAGELPGAKTWDVDIEGETVTLAVVRVAS